MRFGPVADHLDSFHLEWHLGFVRAVCMFGGPSLLRAGDPVGVLAELAMHPSFVFLESLVLGKIGGHGRIDPDAFHDVFDNHFRDLRELFLFDDATRCGLDLSRVLKHAAKLKTLSLSGELSIQSGVELPALERLHLDRTDRRPMESAVEFLSMKTFPALGELAVCGELSAKALGRFLKEGVRLRALRLWRHDNVRAAIEVVLRSDTTKSLELLDLAGGTLGDEDALALARQFIELPRLRVLIVDGNRLSEQVIDELSKSGVNVFAASQRVAANYPEIRFWDDEDPLLGQK